MAISAPRLPACFSTIPETGSAVIGLYVLFATPDPALRLGIDAGFPVVTIRTKAGICARFPPVMRYVAERVFVGRGRFGGLPEPHLKLLALQNYAAGDLVDAIGIKLAGQTHTSGSAWLRHETPHCALCPCHSPVRNTRSCVAAHLRIGHLTVACEPAEWRVL